MSKKKTEKSERDFSRYIQLREEAPVIIETEEGRVLSKKVIGTILVPPEVLLNREEELGEVSSKYIERLGNEYSERGASLPEEITGLSFYLMDKIPRIDESKNILDFTDEEIDIILDYYFGVSIKEAPVSSYYKASRKIAHLQTRPRKKGADLYDILSQEKDEGRKEALIEHAREKEKEGGLSTLTSGLILSAVEYKVVKAIQKHLYQQSKGYDRGDVGGVPPWTLKGIRADKNSSYVVLYPTELTKEVLGREEIGGKDLARVKEAISSLDRKISYDDEEKAYFRLLTIEKVGEGYIVLALRKAFTEGIENNFINARADELKLLSGINSSTTLRLYDLIIEQVSYNPPTLQRDGYIDFLKENILNKVAIKKSYDKNPKRREEDFSTALEELKGIGLISRYENTNNKVRIYPNQEWRKGK